MHFYTVIPDEENYISGRPCLRMDSDHELHLYCLDGHAVIGKYLGRAA
jgi:hypothetical protein